MVPIAPNTSVLIVLGQFVYAFLPVSLGLPSFLLSWGLYICMQKVDEGKTTVAAMNYMIQSERHVMICQFSLHEIVNNQWKKEFVFLLQEERLYWTDTYRNLINSAFLNGTGIMTVIDSGRSVCGMPAHRAHMLQLLLVEIHYHSCSPMRKPDVLSLCLTFDSYLRYLGFE